jgi:hypothetical protein
MAPPEAASGQVKSALMLRSLWIRMIASASSGATVSTSTLSVHIPSGKGIVSVTNTFSIGDAWIRSSACPANTPCTAAAKIRRAPRSRKSSAAWRSVPTGRDDVVDDHRIPAGNVTDHFQHLGDLRSGSLLGDDGQAPTSTPAKFVGPHHSTSIRADHDEVRETQAPKMRGQNRRGAQMIDRDIEESLDRGRVQVDRQHAIGTSGGEQVRQELGADRLAPRPSSSPDARRRNTGSLR